MKLTDAGWKLVLVLNDPGPFAKLQSDMECDAHSQIKQDLFVLNHLSGKTNGYFVEFGASDGKTLSNTWLLEKRFGWQGLLAEPSRHCHDSLRSNRSCRVDTRCVWKTTGDLIPFHETQDHFLSSPGKTASPVISTYDVDSVTLSDLLDYHSSPPHIDYLSVDTEGSELDIMQRFNEDKGFNRYRFNCITIEHNFNLPKRQAILSLLTKHGYLNVHSKISDFDDWYVLKRGQP
jgi:FkbM family methyltransferase